MPNLHTFHMSQKVVGTDRHLHHSAEGTTVIDTGLRRRGKAIQLLASSASKYACHTALTLRQSCLNTVLNSQ